MSVGTGSFMPVRTIPPLRELAPQPKVSASRTATFTPRLARERAAESPQKPAPTTTTSALSGKPLADSAGGAATVSSQ